MMPGGYGQWEFIFFFVIMGVWKGKGGIVYGEECGDVW